MAFELQLLEPHTQRAWVQGYSYSMPVQQRLLLRLGPNRPCMHDTCTALHNRQKRRGGLYTTHRHAYKIMTYLHAMCRGVSLNESLLIAVFGSTPDAMALCTLSTAPALQALNSASSSSAWRVRIVIFPGYHVMQECMWVWLHHHHWALIRMRKTFTVA